MRLDPTFLLNQLINELKMMNEKLTVLVSNRNDQPTKLDSVSSQAFATRISVRHVPVIGKLGIMIETVSQPGFRWEFSYSPRLVIEPIKGFGFLPGNCFFSAF